MWHTDTLYHQDEGGSCVANNPTCRFLPLLHEQCGLAVALILIVFMLGQLMEQSYLSRCLFLGRGGKTPDNHHLTLKTSIHMASDHILLPRTRHSGTPELMRTQLSNLPGGRSATDREPDYLVNGAIIKSAALYWETFLLLNLNFHFSADKQASCDLTSSVLPSSGTLYTSI